METANVQTLYSDSARLKIKLKAPLQQQFENGDGVYPKGLNLTFLDEQGRITTTLRANYGRYDKETDNFDLKGQHMFYSRPKGEYVGNDTKKIMLDFYLINTNLSPEGNKVRATINGTEFMLDRWLPYSIEGLPMGQTKIKLELLNSAGNVIPGPYNTVERTITLKAA
jgi:hypothetical protein